MSYSLKFENRFFMRYLPFIRILEYNQLNFCILICILKIDNIVLDLFKIVYPNLKRIDIL